MKLKITVHGVAYEVEVEVLDAQDEMLAPGQPLPPPPAMAHGPAAVATAATSPVAPPSGSPALAGDDAGVASPIAGTVLEVKVRVGDQVAAGQEVVVIEAMKMETAIAAPRAGRVKAVPVAAGDSVRETQLLVEFE